MTTTAPAIYEHGVLRPLAPLPLAEGARVEVTIADEASLSPVAGGSRASDLLRDIAGLPVESPDDRFSGRDHDRLLYGKSGTAS